MYKVNKKFINNEISKGKRNENKSHTSFDSSRPGVKTQAYHQIKLIRKFKILHLFPLLVGHFTFKLFAITNYHHE